MGRSTTPSLKMVAIAAALAGASALYATEAAADVTCITATSTIVSGKVVTKLAQKKRPSKCLAGEVPAIAGPVGPPGASAASHVYGDGSAGALVVDQPFGTLFSEYATNGNTQFSSITIQAGKKLAVPGGTILRSKGNVTINGKIDVYGQGTSGFLLSSTSTFSLAALPVTRAPSLGIAATAATIGQIGNNTAFRFGGRGGIAPAFSGGLRTISPMLLQGGGSGAPGNIAAVAGFGGGGIMIVAGGTITIGSGGSIDADAASPNSDLGAGGGGGGVVVLAARTAINHAGLIRARGSDGTRASSQAGSGGGGGGGLIILACPLISQTGTNQVQGGDGGVAVSAGHVSQPTRIGGGGGGASAGGGGNGSIVNKDGSSDKGSDGEDGKVFTFTVDPASLL